MVKDHLTGCGLGYSPVVRPGLLGLKASNVLRPALNILSSHTLLPLHSSGVYYLSSTARTAPTPPSSASFSDSRLQTDDVVSCAG